MNPLRLLISSTGLALLLSCGGGGGGSQSSNQGIPGPTNLRHNPGSSPNTFVLSWNPPTAIFDGYNIEYQFGSEAFKQLNTALIPPTNTQLTFYFTNTTPEDTTYTFRMNAAKGTQTSAYSNTASINSGLHTPGQPSGHYDWDHAGVAISWSRNSTVSTDFKIERAQTDDYGNVTGSWAALATADPLASSHLDTTVTSGAFYSYRVTNKRGSNTSPASLPSMPIYTGLPAPDRPTATFDFDKLGMLITWTKNTTFNDGVKLERIETTSYGTQTGTWTQLTPSDPTTSQFLDTTFTPNTYYSYRVTNLRGNASSSSSAPSYCAYAGLQAPSSLSAYWDETKWGMVLSWYGYGTYDAWTLERTVCDTTGTPTGSWSVLATLPAASNSFTDLSTQELTYYRYRISGARGSTASLTVSNYNAVGTPLAAPTSLSAAPVAEGAQLTWQNHSSAATQLVVRRAPASNPYSSSYTDVAILSASADRYVDSPASLGYYVYKVVAKAGYDETASATAAYTTPNPADALVLSSLSHPFPNAADAALTPRGTWTLATTNPFGVISNEDPWTPFFPNNALRSATNFVQVDTQGRPHLVYLTTNPLNSQEAYLRHIWFDGTAWQTEDMGRTQLMYSYSRAGYAFTLDGTGVPQALLETSSNGGSTSDLAYLHKVNGIWTQETLGGIAPAISFDSYRLKLDGAGAPHVLMSSYSSIYECTRNTQGEWSAAALPTGSLSISNFLDGYWTDAENATIVYSVTGSHPTYGTQLIAMQKSSGVWQTPSVVASSESGTINPQMAQSGDRTRIAFVVYTTLGLKAYHLDGNGWHQTLLMDSNSNNYNPQYRVGFDATNKVHILYKNSYPSSGYTEFKE